MSPTSISALAERIAPEHVERVMRSDDRILVDPIYVHAIVDLSDYGRVEDIWPRFICRDEVFGDASASPHATSCYRRRL